MPDTPLSICIVSRRFPPFSGGAERQVSLIARGLAEAGHTVNVLTGRGADPELVRPANVHVLAEPPIRGVGTLLFVFHLALWMLHKRRRYDVILNSMPNETLLVSALCSKLSKAPLVFRLSNIELNISWIQGRCFSFAYRWAIRQADAIIGQTGEFYEDAKQSGLPVEKMTIIPNAADPRFLRETPRLEPQSETARRILWCGRFAKQKNPLAMVEVAKLLRDSGANFVVDMVGNGPLLVPVRQTVKTYSLETHVLLHGEVTDTLPFYQRANIFCLTSTVEGQPNVLLEAMANRIPVIATEIPATRSLIENGKTGLLIPVGQVDLFASGLQQLLASNKGPLFAEDAYDTVCAKHSLQAIAAKYSALFYSLLLHPTNPISKKEYRS